MFGFYRQDLLNDWLQVNWEILVEYPLRNQGNDGLLLECYDSTDNDTPKLGYPEYRVILPHTPATHAIYINGEYIFNCMGAMKHGKFRMSPPFDYVHGQISHTKKIVEKFKDSVFSVGPSYSNAVQ